MTSYVNPIADMVHSQLEASRRVADVLFAGTERIDHVVIEATHRAFTEQVNLAHAALAMRDPKELASLQSTLVSHRPENAANLQKEMVRVFAEVQNEMGRSMKDCIEKFGTSFARSATAPMRSVQERGADGMFNPMGGMFSMWESMWREMATLTSRNISTVRSSYEHVAEEVSRAAAQAGDQVEAAASQVGQAVHAANSAAASTSSTSSAAANGNGQAEAAPAAAANGGSAGAEADSAAQQSKAQQAQQAQQEQAQAERSGERGGAEERRTSHHGSSASRRGK